MEGYLALIAVVAMLLLARLLLPTTRTGPCNKYWGMTCSCSDADRNTFQKCPMMDASKLRNKP